MRRVKFKVWDSISECYYYWGNIQNNQFNDFDLTHYTMEQSTSCRDRHGTEIFEGDLITHHGRNGGEPHPVVYDMSKAAFCGSYGINYPLQEGEFYGLAIEVVGNIHSNR